jgi:hypothetical protein
VATVKGRAEKGNSFQSAKIDEITVARVVSEEQ